MNETPEAGLLPEWALSLIKAKQRKNDTRKALKARRDAGLKARHTNKLRRT